MHVTPLLLFRNSQKLSHALMLEGILRVAVQYANWIFYSYKESLYSVQYDAV